jgi:hypothetical protein
MCLDGFSYIPISVVGGGGSRQNDDERQQQADSFGLPHFICPNNPFIDSDTYTNYSFHSAED